MILHFFPSKRIHAIQCSKQQIMIPTIGLVSQRVLVSLTKVPVGGQEWAPVLGITVATTLVGGLGAVATGFIRPVDDFDPPTASTIWRPLSAFLFPGLFEELIWRAALLPTPATSASLSTIFYHATGSLAASPTTLGLYKTSLTVLAIHVVSHPIFSATIYPRGKQVFGDPRFLFLATIVLGGTTLSYIVSGGSVWAAVFTHAVPVALWRDFFGGEKALQKGRD